MPALPSGADDRAVEPVDVVRRRLRGGDVDVIALVGAETGSLRHIDNARTGGGLRAHRNLLGCAG